MEKFHDRLEALRKKAGEKQADVADCMGINVRNYQRYENGITNPRLSEIIKLARHFNVSVGYMSGDSDYPEEQNNEILRDVLSEAEKLCEKIKIHIGDDD